MEVTLNSKEQKSWDFGPKSVQEYTLWKRGLIVLPSSPTPMTLTRLLSTLWQLPQLGGWALGQQGNEENNCLIPPPLPPTPGNRELSGYSVHRKWTVYTGQNHVKNSEGKWCRYLHIQWKMTTENSFSRENTFEICRFSSPNSVKQCQPRQKNKIFTQSILNIFYSSKKSLSFEICRFSSLISLPRTTAIKSLATPGQSRCSTSRRARSNPERPPVRAR